MSTTASVTTRLANNGALIRAVTWPIVRFMPTIALGSKVIVTRHADVCEILSRDEDFTIAEVNAARMARVNGPFILGMDRSPIYDRERSILERCVEPGDQARIRDTVRGHAAELIAAAVPGRRIDVVQEFARPAAVRLVRDYFGVAGPDEDTMKRWMRAMFYETFLDIGEAPAVRKAGEESGLEFHAYADALITQRRTEIANGVPTPDDLVTRLLRMQGDPETCLSDEAVRRNVGGVVVGAVDTTSKVVAHAIDQLLRRPKQLEPARASARRGDVDEVGRYAFEALRFNPLNPVLARHAARDVTLAEHSRWKRRIRAGRTVYIGVLPAMFDPRVFERPSKFRADRPPESYLHFGGGLHICFGRFVNVIQIPELVAALVSLKGLRFARAHKGIRYDGPFPDQLLLEFDGAE